MLFESPPKADDPAHSTELTGKAFDPVQAFTDFEQWLLSVTNARPIFVSDNPAYDFPVVHSGFHHTIGRNPVNDAMGNVEAFARLLKGER